MVSKNCAATVAKFNEAVRGDTEKLNPNSMTSLLSDPKFTEVVHAWFSKGNSTEPVLKIDLIKFKSVASVLLQVFGGNNFTEVGALMDVFRKTDTSKVNFEFSDRMHSPRDEDYLDGLVKVLDTAASKSVALEVKEVMFPALAMFIHSSIELYRFKSDLDEGLNPDIKEPRSGTIPFLVNALTYLCDKYHTRNSKSVIK